MSVYTSYIDKFLDSAYDSENEVVARNKKTKDNPGETNLFDFSTYPEKFNAIGTDKNLFQTNLEEMNKDFFKQLDNLKNDFNLENFNPDSLTDFISSIQDGIQSFIETLTQVISDFLNKMLAERQSRLDSIMGNTNQ